MSDPSANFEPPTEPVPSDVLWARGVRFHLQALYASAGIVALLALIGFAGVALAGPLASDPPVTAGVLALLIGGICALVGAMTAGLGQIRVLGAARDPQRDPLPVVAAIFERTRTVFALLPRLAIAGCIALITAYLIWMPSGFWGTIVGTFVVIQVALALTVIRRVVLAGSRLTRAQN